MKIRERPADRSGSGHVLIQFPAQLPPGAAPRKNAMDAMGAMGGWEIYGEEYMGYVYIYIYMYDIYYNYI